MFDTIAGLPVHPLVVHAVVVLAPLAAVLLLAYAFVPRWRTGLRWPTLLLAAVSAGAAFVATQSGEQFAQRVGEPGFDHHDKGELAAIACFVLLGAALIVVLLLSRVGVAGLLNAVGILVAVGAGAFVLFAVIAAGHSGSESVWKDIVENTAG